MKKIKILIFKIKISLIKLPIYPTIKSLFASKFLTLRFNLWFYNTLIIVM